MRAVLFDIDGTLVTTRGAGREAFAFAMRDGLGIELETAIAAIDRVDFRGGTDEVLLERVAAELGVSFPRFHEPVIEAYLQVLERTMTPDRVAALPGVHALVEHLETQDDMLVGLLTGNIREGARRKLQVVSLQRLIDRPGGFADDGRERAAIAHAALAKAIRHGVDPQRVVVIGDTQHDVSCARAIGAKAIAVTTGGTDRSVLEESGADLVLENLGDIGPILELVGRM